MNSIVFVFAKKIEIVQLRLKYIPNYCLSMWRQTHFEVSEKNRESSYEDLDIHYHYYHNLVFRTCCGTSDNVFKTANILNILG